MTRTILMVADANEFGGLETLLFHIAEVYSDGDVLVCVQRATQNPHLQFQIGTNIPAC